MQVAVAANVSLASSAPRGCIPARITAFQASPTLSRRALLWRARSTGAKAATKGTKASDQGDQSDQGHRGERAALFIAIYQGQALQGPPQSMFSSAPFRV